MPTIAKRYSLSEISGVKDTYQANPGGPTFASLGQVVFALPNCVGSFCLGQCTCGCNLIPWGICCNFNPNVNSACASSGCCACSFTVGTASQIYVALGAMNGCGASLWRRIL